MNDQRRGTREVRPQLQRRQTTFYDGPKDDPWTPLVLTLGMIYPIFHPLVIPVLCCRPLITLQTVGVFEDSQPCLFSKGS